MSVRTAVSFVFGLKARRQLGECGGGILVRAFNLGAVDGEAAVGFEQRGLARGVAVDLALGRGMPFARRIGLALGGAGSFARGALGLRCGLQFGLRGFQRLALGGGIEARLLKFVLDIDQPRALGEAAGRAGRGMRGGNEAIPAPDVAFGRHQPLAGLELRYQFRAAFPGHDADLPQAACELRRRLHTGCERLDAGGQRGIVEIGAGHRPAHRRGGIDGRIEIVAEGCAECLLKTLGDGDAVDDRRPEVLGLAVDDLGNGAGLGLEPLHALVGLGERGAGGFEPGAGRDMRGFTLLSRGLRLCPVLLRGFRGGSECYDVAETAGLFGELAFVRLDIGDVLVEARKTVAMAADIGLELVAPGGEVGQCSREFAEQLFGVRQRCFGGGDALIDAGTLLDARLDIFLQLGVLGVEALQRGVGVRVLLLLASDVGGKLRQPPFKLGNALLGALFLAVEQVAGIVEPLQAGRGAGFGLAQGRQFGGANRLDARGFRLFAGALGHLANGEIVGVGRIRHVRVGFQPAQVVQHRLGLAHLGGDFAVADRLARLLLQAFHLAGELADHVLDAGEVGLGRLQPQLGFMAAGMQAGDAGGVFQHAAALFGLGLDDLADLALVHEGG